MLKCLYRLPEMKYFPKSYANIQQTKSGDRTAHPARGDHCLQTLDAGYAGGVKEEIVVSPIAQAECALRNPREQRQHNANFKAENNIENDA